MFLKKNIGAKIALLPMIIISLTVFVGCIIYSFIYSLTDSKLIPVFNYVGFDQYSKLIMGNDNQTYFDEAAKLWDHWMEVGGNAFDTAYIY